MIEVYYLGPTDSEKEATVTEKAKKFKGSLTFKEVPEGGASRTIVLTYEFDEWTQAESAMEEIQRLGEQVHVEGPAITDLPKFRLMPESTNEARAFTSDAAQGMGCPS